MLHILFPQHPMPKSTIPEVVAILHEAEASVTVESIDSDIFVASKKLLYKPPLSRGVYGGQVIGQALMAAASTVSDLSVPIHSFHSYFILSGNADRDIVYNVKRLRDGKSFFTRSVVAVQNGRAIFTLLAQFQHPEPSRGLQYHDPMPADIFAPEDLLDIYEYWSAISDHPNLSVGLREYIDKAMKRPVTIDQRIVHRALLRHTNEYRYELLRRLWPLMYGNGKAERYLWMKSHSDMSSSASNIHKCVIAFMSDMAFIPTAMEPLYSADWEQGDRKHPKVAMTVSLDHSMWFHSIGPETEIKADEWLLFGMKCHVAGGSRVLLTAKVWTRDGQLIVSVAQEALIRLADEAEPSRLGAKL